LNIHCLNDYITKLGYMEDTEVISILSIENSTVIGVISRAKLSPCQFMVYSMHVNGRSYREIEAVTKIHYKSISSHRIRAEVKVRSLLKAMQWDEVRTQAVGQICNRIAD
jgi:hypothetical protein